MNTRTHWHALPKYVSGFDCLIAAALFFGVGAVLAVVLLVLP